LHNNGNDNGSNGNNGSNREKDNNGKGASVDKDNKEKWAEKQKGLNGKGYKGKGKYENKGKHLGWYKNGKYGEMPENPELIETTYYLNDVGDPLTQVLMTYDEKDNYKAAYAYGLERFEVQALDSTRPESQDPLYYLYDGLGSVAQLTRPNGEVRDHYRYDEFGVPAPGAKLSEDGRNVNHNSFGYTGESWDEEDDLLYLRSRYYQADAGRFLTRDNYDGVLHTPLSRHLYVYVENNPINYVDPLGLYRLGWTKEIGYLRAYFENDIWNDRIEMISLVPIVGDVVKTSWDLIYRGDIPQTVKDLAVAGVSFGEQVKH